VTVVPFPVRGANLEARARAAADRIIRNSMFGNPARYEEAAAMAEAAGIEMPPLLDDAGIKSEVDRMWPYYADMIETGIIK